MRPQVGIIANPASGKDIRRLVALGTVSETQQKVNIVRRVLRGLHAGGARCVLMMPDAYGIWSMACQPPIADMEVRSVDMEPQGTARDSVEAARIMRNEGVGCIVVLGGDGTHRAVAKGCGDVPLVAISTGTNNVFPGMVEGGMAGLAAALVALERVDQQRTVHRRKRLEVVEEGGLLDIALIDVAVCSHPFVASRAIWRPEIVRQVFLTQAQPSSMGLSSIGGALCTIGPQCPYGLALELGGGPCRALAAIAPGLFEWVSIRDARPLRPLEGVELSPGGGVVAVDGERELEVPTDRSIEVRLSLEGPKVVDVEATLEVAAGKGLLLQGQRPAFVDFATPRC